MKLNKKILVLSSLLLISCSHNSSSINTSSDASFSSDDITNSSDSFSSCEVTSTYNESNFQNDLNDEAKKKLSASCYVENKMDDFSIYENTSSYVKVSTPSEFLLALENAKCDYVSTFDETNNKVNQTLNKEGKVKVIEILNDMDLGYYTLTKNNISSPLLSDFASKVNNISKYFNMSDMFLEHGISQIKVENVTDLLIYSKNGSKLTHCGFKLTSDNNVCFRNLSFDEIWQWEDTSNDQTTKVGDYDAFGWAYFKISFSENIWIDHCTFGKSYDGQIDVSNPIYNNAQTAFRAPYKASFNGGVHISYCAFNAGSDDKDGYIYKMMEKLENTYLEGKNENFLYKTLRDKGATFDEILYGIALPQKKGFLLGDSGNGTSEYDYNLSLKVSFAYSTFTNIEDRLPKLRGGNAYMLNCIVDSSSYYNYRKILQNKGCKIDNGKLKNALVSQGVLCGNGGGICLDNSIYKGIEYFLKNNDKGGGENRPVTGGYLIKNSIYQKDENSSLIKGSSTDEVNPFVSSSSTLNTTSFSWHNENNQEEFIPSIFNVDELEEMLNSSLYKPGINNYMSSILLKSKL